MSTSKTSSIDPSKDNVASTNKGSGDKRFGHDANTGRTANAGNLGGQRSKK
jgi:hypothetical protein